MNGAQAAAGESSGGTGVERGGGQARWKIVTLRLISSHILSVPRPSCSTHVVVPPSVRFVPTVSFYSLCASFLCRFNPFRVPLLALLLLFPLSSPLPLVFCAFSVLASFFSSYLSLSPPPPPVPRLPSLLSLFIFISARRVCLLVI